MKSTLTSCAALAAMLIYQSAAAIPSVTIVDDYVGADAHGRGDVIGDQNKFQIDSMDVSLDGTVLKVVINTAFAGLNDNKLFAYASDTVYSKIGDTKMGIGYGDLLLSDKWDPVGPAPYASDDNEFGTVWTYGFALGYDRWDLDGTGTLYELSDTKPGSFVGSLNDYNTLLSEDFMSSAVYRNGQEVAVDTNANGVTEVTTSVASWETDEIAKDVIFMIDLANTDLLDSDEIALKWGMTCANDTIEGKIDVPVTPLLLLLGLGLPMIGAGSAIRKRI